MDIILIGAPGAGKGTQAEKLTQIFGIRHVASGDLFHKAFEEQTELGLKARMYVDLGELVPDEMTIPLALRHIEEPESRHGVVLDGFPRTLAQALALDEELQHLDRQIDLVISLKVEHGVLLKRLAGRVFCKANFHVYHVELNPPREPGICDIDGSPLYQRSDDTGEAVRKRLVNFYSEVNPILEHYQKQNKLREVDGNQSIDQVHAMIMKEINAYLGKW
jgi:adenylate kinase